MTGPEILNRVFNNADDSVDTSLQDQTTRPVQLNFVRDLGDEQKITSQVSVDDYTVAIADTTDFAVGKLALLISDSNNFYFGTVLSKTATELTLDTPIDYAYEVDDEAIPQDKDMAVDGSATPLIYKIRGASGTIDVDVTFDITRILGVIETATSPELSDFGDIAGGITKGIVLRKSNGIKENINNLKSNADIMAVCYDMEIIGGGTGFFSTADGIAFRMTFAGQDKHGVAIRLEADESLELIVQDSLTSLSAFSVVAEGHVVD